MSPVGPLRRRVVGVLVILATLSFGCAGDGDDSEATVSTPSTTADEDASERQTDDQDLAEAIVLKESDLPEDLDWTSTPSEADAEGESAMRSCLGLPPASGSPSAESPTFSIGDVTRVDSEAIVSRSVGSANEVSAVITSPKLVDCVRARFEAQILEQPDANFGPATTAHLDFPAVGDGTRAVRMSTSVETEDGERIPLFVDVIVVQKGRVGMTLTLMNAPDPFPTDLAVALAETMSARA
jgi:hypothetical protein